MNDILAKEFKNFHHVKETSRLISSLHGFDSVELPILEYTSVFLRTLGETSDIVNKEMYNFTDKKGDSLTLRPEFTAGIARSIITNKLYNELPLKLFTTGSLFRYERPQKGRQREFRQINAEIIGLHSPETDIDLILLGIHILKELKIYDNITLDINSLGDTESYIKYKKVLVEYFEKYENSLSELSKKRLSTNPLRILDSKEAEDKQLIMDAPNITDYYSDYSRQYWDKILEYLDCLEIKYNVNPKLVRGLDYYCHTVFEFISDDLGSQGTVMAGGRYDKLIEIMGGKSTPAVGFAAGIERLASLISLPDTKEKKIALVPLEDIDPTKLFKIANQIRYNHIPLSIHNKSNLKKTITNLIKKDYDFAIIIGSEEINNDFFTLKDIKSSTQEKVDFDTLIDRIS